MDLKANLGMSDTMRPNATIALVAALALSACQTSSEADYVQIGYGPSFKIAHAQCDMRKASVNQGYIAFGSPGFVAGVGLGNAIDNAVAQDRFMKNCLILKGWEKREAGSPRGTPASAASAVPQQRYGHLEKCPDWYPRCRS